MSFDEQSYRDYLHNAIQSEDYYWNYIEEIQRSLLTDKEKPKYAPTLDLVNEVLRDKKEKGTVKMLALRLLGSTILPQSDAFPTNTDYVTRLLKHKLLLEVINETCQFRADVQDDKRGGTMFKDEGKEIGEAHLRYALEFIKMLASTWEKTKTKSGDQVPTQFYVIYHQLLDAGVKFPDRFEYFEEVKKKNKSSNSATTKPQADSSSTRQQPTPQPAANTASTPGGPSKIDFIQIYKESFNLIESILHIVNDNLKIEDFVKEAIEGQEHAFNDELQTLTNILNTQGDNANQEETVTLWNAYYFYQELTQTIPQLQSKNYAEKTYKAFRKNLLLKAEEYYPTLWSAPEPPAQSFPASNAFDTKPQPASAIPNDNNDPWGGGASDFGGFGFNNNDEKSKPAEEGFGGNFGGFNFEEQKQQEDLDEQRRKAQRQKDEKIAADLVGSQRNQGRNQQDNDQQELDRQMRSFGFGDTSNNNNNNNNNNFDQGFGGGGFSNGFDVQPSGGANNNNMQNSGGFGGFNNFDTVQETKKDPKPEKKDKQPTNQFNNEEFTYQPPSNNYFYNEPAEKKEYSPDFTRPTSQANEQPQQQQQQQPKRAPANPKEKSVSFQENSQFYGDNNKNSYYNNSDSKRSTGAHLRESFVEFSELSKSDISASDFPLRNTIINNKEYRGRLHSFNKEIFQVLQDYNLTQQLVRRFKIANLKLKSPLIQSSAFDVGVISERIFDSNSSRYLIKTDLFLGNKTLYPVENFSIEFEGDYTSNLYIKNDTFPEIIEANKQLKVQCVLSYSKTPYSLINGTITGRINGEDVIFTVFLPNLLPRYINFIDASNHMQYFRSKWRQKRDYIIKSDTFALNKRVIRTPVYFKRYFPQFSENMSLDEFIQHNKTNQAAPINYKLRGTIELDIQTIQYMLKIIVRPNFTAVIQVIPFSGYINTAEALIDHFVFLFGNQ